jgi:hypothetical protein
MTDLSAAYSRLLHIFHFRKAMNLAGKHADLAVRSICYLTAALTLIRVG